MSVRCPCKCELGLRSTAVFSTFLRRRLFSFNWGFLDLIVDTIDLEAILEDPLSFAIWLLISKATLIEGTVRVDPLAVNDLALLPISIDFHSSRLVDVGASALLLSELPPS